MKTNSKPSSILLALLILCALILCFAAHGQETNAPVSAVATHPIPANIKADLVKLFEDCLDKINLSGLTSAGFIAWISARLLRKGVPDNLQTGIVGSILKHAALEINPEPAIKPQPAAIAAEPSKL